MHRSGLIEKNLQPVIDRPGFAEQQQPTDGVQNKRRAEGSEGGEVAQAAQRRCPCASTIHAMEPPSNVAKTALPMEK